MNEWVKDNQVNKEGCRPTGVHHEVAVINGLDANWLRLFIEIICNKYVTPTFVQELFKVGKGGQAGSLHVDAFLFLGILL